MRSAVRYGLYYGLTAVAWGMLMYVTGLNRTEAGQSINYISLIFPLIFMYLAINEWRHKQGHGFITFSKGFNEAIVVGLIGSAISLIYLAVYIHIIDTDYLNYVLQQQALKFEESGMDQAQVDEMMARTASMMTPGKFILWGGIGMLFLVAVMATIMAGVLKKPNPEEIS